MIDNPFADLRDGTSPRDVQPAHLAIGRPKIMQVLRQPFGVPSIGARQRYEVLLCGMRANSAVPNGLLDGLGQLPGKREATRHPARRALQEARQILLTQLERLDQLAQEPRILDRGASPVRLVAVRIREGVSLAERQDHRLYEIEAQLLHGRQSPVAVDQHIPVVARNDENGLLLAIAADRSEESRLSTAVRDAERGEGKVDEV